MPQFKVISEYTPSGDQPQAIEKLAEGLENGLRQQVLLGVTGSGKTYTMAKVIEKVQRPTLVLAHNKTLAAQLCEEFREFFPENAVEYFVSYYDYYQPEAYIPHTDTFIEKDAAINAEIERLRHSATAALFERRDVIVVASVSCIYGLGDPIDYANMVISLRQGKEYPRDQLLRKLVEIRYDRNDVAFERNMFRVRGDTVEIYPVYANGYAIRASSRASRLPSVPSASIHMARRHAISWAIPAPSPPSSSRLRIRKPLAMMMLLLARLRTSRAISWARRALRATTKICCRVFVASRPSRSMPQAM